MKFNTTTLVAYLGVGALLAWLGFEMGVGQSQKILLCCVTAVEFIVAALIGSRAVDAPDGRNGVNVRVLTLTVVALAVLMNLIFSFFSFSAAALCVPAGILMLAYVTAAVKLLKTRT